MLDTKTALAALAALAQESRLAIFRLLVQAGPAGVSASKIAEALAVAPSSLSFHLKELSHADLLLPRQEGRFVFYSVKFDTMYALMAFLTDNCCGGEPCLPVCGTACEIPAVSAS